MQFIYFTFVAIVLYFFSDWLLHRAELYYGKRFEQREVVFLFILATLAITSFSLINSFLLS